MQASLEPLTILYAAHRDLLPATLSPISWGPFLICEWMTIQAIPLEIVQAHFKSSAHMHVSYG